MKSLNILNVYHMPRLKIVNTIYLKSINSSIFKFISFITLVGLIGAAGQDNAILAHSPYSNIEFDPSDANYLQMALSATPLFPELAAEEEEDVDVDISHGTNTPFESNKMVFLEPNRNTSSPKVPIVQQSTAVQITHPYESPESNNNHNTKELTSITNSNQNYTNSHHRTRRDIGVNSLLELENFSTSTNNDDIHLQSTGITGSQSSRRPKRSVVHLYDMVVCATGCNPLAYKGYGCYCGFLGSGLTVDGIDRCCAKHDFCYHLAKCPPLLTYFVPYYWTCNDGRPNCVSDYRGWKGICGAHLCECDRQFAECLRKFPCPRARAMCVTSPFRYTPEPETYYYYP